MCDKIEDICEVYTVKDFEEAIQKLGDNVYSVKITKIKLKERHGDSLQCVNREGRSDIILLDNVSVILTESWYDQRKSNQPDEAERIIKTAANRSLKLSSRIRHTKLIFIPLSMTLEIPIMTMYQIYWNYLLQR